MVVGVAVEVLQTRVAGQDAEARDLAADAAGAAVALLAPPLLGWFGGGRTHARHGTWAPTSIVPIGIAAATVFGGVLVGLTYLRHVGGGVLGDDPPPTWVLHRPGGSGRRLHSDQERPQRRSGRNRARRDGGGGGRLARAG